MLANNKASIHSYISNNHYVTIIQVINECSICTKMVIFEENSQLLTRTKYNNRATAKNETFLNVTLEHSELPLAGTEKRN